MPYGRKPKDQKRRHGAVRTNFGVATVKLFFLVNAFRRMYACCHVASEGNVQMYTRCLISACVGEGRFKSVCLEEQRTPVWYLAQELPVW